MTNREYIDMLISIYRYPTASMKCKEKHKASSLYNAPSDVLHSQMHAPPSALYSQVHAPTWALYSYILLEHYTHLYMLLEHYTHKCIQTEQYTHWCILILVHYTPYVCFLLEHCYSLMYAPPWALGGSSTAREITSLCRPMFHNR